MDEDKESKSALNLPEMYLQEHAISLNRSVNIIASWLENDDLKGCDATGLTKDWKGLAMAMRYNRMDINAFRSKPNKTETVFDDWVKNTDGPTIGKLLDILKQLKLLGLLSNREFIEAIVTDVDVHRARVIKESSKRIPVSEPVLDLETAKPDYFGNANNQLVISDHEKIVYFDALICYAQEDIVFVQEMLVEIEDKFDLKLCVDVRDFLVGSYRVTNCARIMEERCKRIILVLSPDFVKTEMCQFQKEYALCLAPGSASKKVLPIMYRECELPSGLKHLNTLSYTRSELRVWFWPRLGGSLRAALPVTQLEHKSSPDNITSDIPDSPATRDQVMNFTSDTSFNSHHTKEQTTETSVEMKLIKETQGAACQKCEKPCMKPEHTETHNVQKQDNVEPKKDVNINSEYKKKSALQKIFTKKSKISEENNIK